MQVSARYYSVIVVCLAGDTRALEGMCRTSTSSVSCEMATFQSAAQVGRREYALRMRWRSRRGGMGNVVMVSVSCHA